MQTIHSVSPPRVSWPVLAALLLSGACGADEPGSGDELRASLTGQNAVLITLDTTQIGALGCYGQPKAVTPHLDQLAAEGVKYMWARTVTPVTLPSHASMLTGLYPPRHTVRVNLVAPLPASATTLAERARAAGVDTAAFVAAVVLDRRFGLDQGFELYDGPERTSDWGSGGAERLGQDTVAQVESWLAAREKEAPFFLWVHFFEPHYPYEPDALFAEQAGGDAYLGEVARMDAAVGRLIAALRDAGEYERSFVTVVADHGEALGLHGESNHGTLCYEPTIRVPLLLRYPDGYRAGERSSDIASVVDVYPTMLEALGIEVDAGIDGLSLYRTELPRERGVYFESYYGYVFFGWSPIVGWATRRWKYLDSGQGELFWPRRDPGEQSNLVQGEAEAVASHREAIQALVELPRLAPAAEDVSDPEIASQIASLGYATGVAVPQDFPAPLVPLDLPSPASRNDEMEQFNQASVLIGRGEHARALPILREIVARNPRNAAALDYLGMSLMHEGRFSEAIETYNRVLARGFGLQQTHLNLAQCLRAEGDLDSALSELERAYELDPGNPVIVQELAALLEQLGRADEAREYRDR